MFCTVASVQLFVIDINECENAMCEDGGTCRDVINGFECACAAGFTGEVCETGKSH